MSYSQPGININDNSEQQFSEGKFAKIPDGTTHLWQCRVPYGVKGSISCEGNKILYIGKRFVEYEQPNGVIRTMARDAQHFFRDWSTTKLGALEQTLERLEKDVVRAKETVEDRISRAMCLREQIEHEKSNL